MPVLMNGEGGGRVARRDYPRLFFALCNCGGPQPSLDKPLDGLHAADCPYRLEVASGSYSDGNPRADN